VARSLHELVLLAQASASSGCSRHAGKPLVNYHWNWRIFWEPAPNGTGTYLDMLLSGLVSDHRETALLRLDSSRWCPDRSSACCATLPSKTANRGSDSSWVRVSSAIWPLLVAAVYLVLRPAGNPAARMGTVD